MTVSAVGGSASGGNYHVAGSPDARRRERFLKTTKGKRLLKQQIRDILIQKNVLSIDKIGSDQ